MTKQSIFILVLLISPRLDYLDKFKSRPKLEECIRWAVKGDAIREKRMISKLSVLQRKRAKAAC